MKIAGKPDQDSPLGPAAFTIAEVFPKILQNHLGLEASKL